MAVTFRHGKGANFKIYQNDAAEYADLQANNLDVIKQIPTDSLATVQGDLPVRVEVKDVCRHSRCGDYGQRACCRSGTSKLHGAAVRVDNGVMTKIAVILALVASVLTACKTGESVWDTTPIPTNAPVSVVIPNP